jgi:putative ABC transport system ATP-binding protein
MRTHLISMMKALGKNLGASESRMNGHGCQSPHLIELISVTKIYQTAAGDFQALKCIDLAINQGEFVAIIGRSGSGKSTLMNMITGIDRPTTGGIWVGGTAVHKLNENDLARWRGRNVGIVFQFFQLLPTLTVIENVMLPMDFCGTYPIKERRVQAMRLLELVEMSDQADKLPSALSGGQQQRVAIARALANDPPVLIADEPTGNLDSKTADAMFKLFERLAAEGKTVVMVTHDPSLAQRVTRAVGISDGGVVSGSAANLPPLNRPENAVNSAQKQTAVLA